MKLTLQVPDELYETYAAAANSDVPSEVAAFMLARLDHFQWANAEGYLHLDPATRVRLEELMAGPLPTVDKLIERVSALASITLGGIRLDFSPGQLAEIARRAKRNGESVEVLTRRIVKTMESLFFTGM